MKTVFALLLLAFAFFARPLAAASVSFTTLNCYWFLGEEASAAAEKPRTTEEYSLKAGHLIGLLPADAPLFIGLQEIGNDKDVLALANAASRRYRRSYQSLFSQGKDSATKQDVGALLDTSRGWGVYGKASRSSDLEKELSKHLVARLTNAYAKLDVCVVHLRVPRDADSAAKQVEQNRALLRWAMRHLAADPAANVIILGDFNEGKRPGNGKQALSVLFQARPPLVDTLASFAGKPQTHANGNAYDRILISDALAQGHSRLKFQTLVIGTHSHGRGDTRRLYTDHFPVTAIFDAKK